MSAGRTDSGDPGHEPEESDGASGRAKPRRRFLRRVLLRLVIFVPLFLALLVLALAVYTNSAAFESQLRERLILRLEEQLQTKVGLERIEVRLLPTGIEFFELNVQGTDGEPALEVPRGEIGISLRGLLGRRLELDRIELDRPLVSLRFDESGQHNLPIPAGGGGDGALQVSVGQTLIRDGEVAFQDVRWPVSAMASEVGFEVAGFGAEGAQFDLRLRGVQVRGSEDHGSEEGAEVDLGLRLEIADGSIALPRIELSGDNVAATLAGSWPGEDDEPTFSLQLVGDVEAELLRRLGWLPLDLVGRFDLQGELSVAPSTGVVYQTSLGTRRARLFGRELRSLSGTLEGQRDLLKVGFDANWHGGAIQAAVELSPEVQDSRRLDVKVVGQELTLASLLEDELAQTSLDLAWDKLSATASLEFDYAFDVRAAQAGIGRGVIRATPEGGAIPVSGSVPFLIENGVLRSEAVAVRTPSMSVDGALAFALGDSAGSGVFLLNSPAVGASSDEIFTLLRQDRPDWWFTQGRGSLEGRLEVVDGEPSVRLSGSVDRLASAQLEVDRVEGVARYQQGAFRDLETKLFRAGGTLEVRGTVPLLSDQGEPIRGLPLIQDLTGELEDWPLESFAPDLGFRGRATGRLGYLPSSRLGAAAQQEGLFFEGRLADLAQDLMDETFRFGGDLDVRGSLRGDVVDLETLRSVRGGRLRGEGRWRVDTGEVQAQLRLAKSELLLERSGERFQLDGSVALSGLIGSPQLQAELRASSEDSRTAELSLRWDGESGSATGLLPGVGAFAASGSRNSNGTTATATFPSVDVNDVLASFADESRAGAVLREVDGNAALEVQLEAAPGEPAAVRVESPRLDLVVGQQRLRLIEPASVLIEDGRIEFESLFLESSEGNAEVFLVGEARPVDEDGSRPLDLRIQAAGPAEWLEKLGLQGDLTGRLELLSSVAGTTEEPLFNGVAALRGGSFQAEDFPYAVEGIEVVTLIYPDRAVVDRGVGRVAGGTVRAEGEVAFPKLDVRLRGAFDDIRMRYPDDWSVAGDGEVTLNRESGKPFQLRGQVRVAEMVYGRDIARGFGQLLRTMFEPSTERIAVRDEDPLLVMDLDVVGRRALKIRNNVAEMEGDLALRVRGDPSAPRLFGEISLRQGGRLDYGGEQYAIERGRLVFDSPYSNEPQLDLSATTRRLDYTVTLALSGTRDRLTATLSSDPPLPELDVWSLLASGDVASSPGLGGPQLDRSSVGAEALLYGQASSLVEDRVSSLFGLDRFRLNPISSGDSLASARVTVGKRFSRDLFVTYSVDPSSTGDGVVEVEWRLSDRVVLVLSQNADGTYSVAARLEQVF